jgi:hypothetical protein
MKTLARHIYDVLFTSCERSSRLISDSMERDLTRWEWIALRLHQGICAGCRRFERHMRFLRALVSQWLAAATAGASGEQLSDSARGRIATRLQREQAE